MTVHIEQQRRPENGKEYLAAEWRWRFHALSIGPSDTHCKRVQSGLATEFNDALAMAAAAAPHRWPMRGGNPDGWVVHFRFARFRSKETRARS